MANLFFTEDFAFDSHCHLSDARFDQDREVTVQSALDAGVAAVIDVAVNLETSKATIQNALNFPGVVFATVGIDPDVLTPGSELYERDIDVTAQMSTIKQLIIDNLAQIVGIGETGIDNYWTAKAVADARLPLRDYDIIQEQQEALFTLHLALAEETKLPLTIHSRGAEQRCVDIVKSFPAVKGVFHSFTGTYEIAKQIIDAGWGLGVNGIITFKNAAGLREMYSKILGEPSPDWTVADLYRRGVYLETDAPYLAPEGKRGERNEPANIAEILTKLLSS